MSLVARPVSAEDVELVRSAYEAWNAGDRDAFFQNLDPDVEWIPAAQFVEGKVQGIDNLRQLIDSFTEAFEEIQWKPVRVEQGTEEGLVVAVLDTVTKGRGSGAELSVRVAHLLRMRDGKVVWGKVYPSAEAGLEAAGLDPAAYLT